MEKIGGARLFAFIVAMVSNVIVAIQVPTVIGEFGVWSTASLTALIAGRSWQHISNGKHSVK